ncbi:hypothetical protein Ddye_011340 [Dipteronia dyeriana]|uniref:Uncharacterized protein n=1 Tax=Dipteronia dyeriana TaxID=168575 RepID=A0AAD9X2B8_9ROSI|nr:hypothetical protein Ddye_011340 [Dipteronia dyeriana]
MSSRPKLQRCTLNLVDYNAKLFDLSSLADVVHLNELSLHFDDMEELNINCVWNTVQKIQEFQGFKNLHIVTIECYRVRDMTWLIFAPNLKAITLNWCKSLEEVISKEKLDEVVSEKKENLNPFSKLQSLEILGAERLKSIYWKALLSPRLKKIDVMKCPNLLVF